MSAHNKEVEGVIIILSGLVGTRLAKRQVSGWTRGIFKACAIESKAGDKVEMVEMWSYLDRSTILDTATQELKSLRLIASDEPVPADTFGRSKMIRIPATTKAS